MVLPEQPLLGTLGTLAIMIRQASSTSKTLIREVLDGFAFDANFRHRPDADIQM